MIQLFYEGGFFMWFLLIFAIVVLVLTIKKFIELFIKKETQSNLLEKGVNAIIFWGGFCAVMGFFAHFTGIFLAMEEIYRAHDISPAIVAKGYSMSLITVLFGLLIFMFSAIVWFVYRWKVKQLSTQ